MTRGRYTTAVALALAAAVSTDAMADNEATAERTVEVSEESEATSGLVEEEITNLEAAVKKVEDELRERREFVIEAKRVPQEVQQDLDAQIAHLQSQQEKVANELDRTAKDLAKLKGWQDVERERGAFLGISGAPVTGALREQLKLPRGVGLVVEHVQPKSAAEEAGVKRFDVLHKLDDQLLVNPHQLAVLVRTRKPGEEVKLTVIRGGESKVLSAKLTEAELEPLEEANVWGVRPFWGQKLQEAIRPENQVRLERPMAGAGVLTRVREKDGSEKIVAVDDRNTMIMTRQGGKNELRVLSREGKELFRGPIDDENNVQNLPEEVRTKARSLLGTAKGDGAAGETVQERREWKKTDRRTVEVSEDGLTLRITAEGYGGEATTHLNARDKSGKRLFDGPIDTEKQRDGLPREVAERLESPRLKAMLEGLREGK